MSGFVDPGIITGIAATLIGTIVGAFLTYTLSKTQRRNERLIEGIYRPLLGQLGQVLERIQDADSPDLKGLDAVRQDGMYFVMNAPTLNVLCAAYSERPVAEKGTTCRLVC